MMSNNMKALMRVAKGPILVVTLMSLFLQIPWADWIWSVLFIWSMSMILILTALLMCGLVDPMKDT